MDTLQKRLRVFVVMMQSHSMKTAALRNSVSTATASRMIRQLEEDLGMPLFEREGQHLKPLRNAELFLEKALEMLEAYGRLEDFKRTVLMEGAPQLRVAFFNRYAEALAPVMARLLKVKLPDRRIFFDQHSFRDFETTRHLHKFDFAVGYSNKKINESLNFKNIGVDRLMFCMHKSHPLANLPSLSAEEVADEKFIVLSSDTFISRHVSEELPFLSSGSISFEASNTSLALSLVDSGLGMHLTNEIAAAPWKRRSCTCTPLRPEKTIPIQAIWPKKSKLPQDVLEVCIETAREALRILSE